MSIEELSAALDAMTPAGGPVMVDAGEYRILRRASSWMSAPSRGCSGGGGTTG